MGLRARRLSFQQTMASASPAMLWRAIIPVKSIATSLATLTLTLALALLIVLGLTVAANSKAIEANMSDLWSGAWETQRFHDVEKIVPVGGLLVVLMVAGGSMVGCRE